MLRSVGQIFRAIFSIIEKILEFLSMAMLMAMTAIICYQVLLRFVFNRSPSWGEEIAIVLMIWFGILAIPIGVKHKLHIGIEFIFRMFPPKAQYLISRCIYLLIAAFGVMMIVYGIELTEFMTMSTLPATKLSSAVEYVVLPLSGLMLVYNSLEFVFQSYAEFLKQDQLPEE
jgi:TRAP-type C4-dicarboxylate transport system permease small subunit